MCAFGMLLKNAKKSCVFSPGRSGCAKHFFAFFELFLSAPPPVWAVTCCADVIARACTAVFYFSLDSWAMRSHICPNWLILVWVAFKTLLSVNIDGHRGWPVDSNRLLLLNVVASSPQNRARPERVIFLLNAISSIAAQTVECFNMGNLSFAIIVNDNLNMIESVN